MEFSSIDKLQKEINKRIDQAVKDTSVQICNKLKEIIQDDYYNMYKPKFYERTYQFLNSAAMDIVSKGSAIVYMNNNGSYKDATMQYVQEIAAEGCHGNMNIQTSGRYWDTFLEYVSNNAENLLKQNLHKQGL